MTNVQGFPLSPQQRHLWKLTREQVGPSPYWSRCTVSIRGPLNVGVLRSILERLPARFEILRTTFFASEEMSTALQVIDERPATTTIDVHELGALDAAQRETAVGRITQQLTAALAADRSASLQVSLAALSAHEHLLMIGTSALRSDRAGLANLVADIARHYAAAMASTSPSDEVLQYADVSLSLNDILESPDTDAGRRFWAAQDLSPALTVRLPFERQASGNSVFTRRSVPVRIPPATSDAAAAVAARCNASLEMFALTCLQTLLQRTTSIGQLAVGYVSDGRGYPELEPAVGLFARCLPLSGELPDEASFRDALQRITDAVRSAKSWAECVDIQRAATARSRIFVRVAFERQDVNRRYRAHDVELEVVDAEACVDRFALKLCVDADGRPLQLDYDGSVCADEDANRLAAQFERLFASAAEAPDHAIGELHVLPADQKRQVVALAGGHSRSDAPDSFHRRFETHAARVPNATALVCEDASLTYAQLNDRANQLAHHLRALDIGADRLVGICLERSIDVIVSILAAMKAGGAYVPLDPQLPPSRIAAMIDESQPVVVVSRDSLTNVLPAATRTVLLDRDRSAIDASSTANPANHANLANLAYVLFTSGSTGKPKGVAIEHQQLAHYVDALSARMEFPAGASFATVTTFAADLGHTAIYPALASGGCLHIVTEERASDPGAFADYFDRHRIDVLKIVPSHLKALLSSSRPERVLPKRRLILGGEACPWDLVDEVHRLAPTCLVFNHYGPTETTVGAMVYEVRFDAPRPPTATVPIGRPLDHARGYVVDRQLRLVPFWVAGELCIGGAGVARGYFEPTDAMREKFVADSWAGDPSARLYRTGDRVRMLPDGLVEFLGRGDNQIKIRGFRVEIGEIESALRRHAEIRDVAVLAQDDGAGVRLAAFVVTGAGVSLRPAELKSFLYDQGLPDYMAPSAFVGLDALPLTSNGKLDRQRLATLVTTASDDDADEEPLTEWEALVAGIWREYLGVDQIQARDNFYDLGGHSLLAIQVVTALEKRARVQISPRDLVFHTLKQFAALCESKSPDAQPSAVRS